MINIRKRLNMAAIDLIMLEEGKTWDGAGVQTDADGFQYLPNTLYVFIVGIMMVKV